MSEAKPAFTRLRSHIPSLDGLRGLAVVVVILHHLAGSTQPTSFLHRIFLRTWEAGWSGVDLFFVLSGFLITGILMESRGRSGALTTFYARRTLRIFPLYYLSLIILIKLWPMFTNSPEEFVTIQANQAWYWTYLVNILIVSGGSMDGVSASHFWSLAVEEQFYLFWPFVVLFVSDRALLRWTIGMIIGAALFRLLSYQVGWGNSGAYMLTFSRLDSLGWGAMVSIILRDSGLRAHFTRHAMRVIAIAAVGFVIVTALQGSFRRGPLMLGGGLIFLAAGYGALVAIAATEANPRLQRFLEFPAFTFFGKYSYAMYIAHPFVIEHLGIYLGKQSWWPYTRGESLTELLLFSVLCFVATTAIALVSWNLFERWFVSLKDHFQLGPKPALNKPAESTVTVK